MSNALIKLAYQAKIDSGPAKSVLVRLCDFANDDGSSVYPSVPRIAADCELGQRTVQDALRRLEALRVLVLVKEADAAHRLAREYRIDPAALSAIARPDDDRIANTKGCRSRTGAGAAPVQEPHQSGAGAAPSTTIVTTIERNLSVNPAVDLFGEVAGEPASDQRREPNIDAMFGEWWKAAPRRVAKGNALRAYRSALKLASPAELLAGIRRYAAEVAGREQRYIAHPASWLNAQRWLDEPARESGDHHEQHREAPGAERRGGWAIAAERHLAERARSADGPDSD